MRKYLTTKERACIDLLVSGKKKNLTEAVLQVYDCKSKNSAYVISFKLSRKELFKNELIKAEEVKEEIIKGEGRKMAEIIESVFPKAERVEILAHLARSAKSEAAKLGALEQVNKITGEFKERLETDAEILIVIKNDNGITRKFVNGKFEEISENPAALEEPKGRERGLFSESY